MMKYSIEIKLTAVNLTLPVLNPLMKQPGMDYELALSFKCLKALKNTQRDTYLQTQELYTNVTNAFKQWGHTYAELYCRVTLLVIEQDYQQRNIQMKKLMN